jgi:multidrug resistance efflux pump
MVELVVGTYGVLCWLLFVRLKLVPVNVYTIFTAIAGGGVLLLLLYVTLSVFQPVSLDVRMYAPVVQIVPEVRGVVIDVPIEANRPLKKGDILFRIESPPFQIEVDRLRAALAAKNSKFAQLAEQLAAAEAGTKAARAVKMLRELLKLAREADAGSERLANGLAESCREIAATRERVVEWRDKLIFWLRVAAVANTLTWLWIGAGQLALIGWGRRLRK